MDSKNVIAAISLSAAVIIIYGLFFAPPPPDPKKINNEKNNVVESTSEAPSLDQNIEVSKFLEMRLLKMKIGCNLKIAQ